MAKLSPNRYINYAEIPLGLASKPFKKNLALSLH